jgi:hypothetical protein
VSDASQGPGWWQASDGKWYPPQSAPQPPPPPPPGAGSWQQPPSSWQQQPVYTQPQRRGRGCLFGIVGALGVAIIIIVVVAIAASNSSTPGSGTKSHPAAADVSITSCTVDPALKIPLAKGTVLNHSSDTSDYTFTISFSNTAGTVVAQGGGTENNIAPHQTATFSVNGDAQVSGPVTCKVVEVTRFASH